MRSWLTYSLGLILREARGRRRRVTWSQLVREMSAKLKKLEYDQKPVLACPNALKNERVPWSHK